MSDRTNTITVVLENEMRTEDVEAILISIGMIRGVLTAQPNITDHTEWMAQERAKRELGEKLWEVIYPKQ